MAEEEKGELKERKRPAIGAYHPTSEPTIINTTVCTKEKRPWLASEEVHAILREVWMEASSWRVGRYMIMPDHIHLFAGLAGTIPFENWVVYWKSLFTKRHEIDGHRWQSRQWDRRVRTRKSYEEKWEYIRHNPVRHGLVEKPEDWPYQGELFTLDW